MAMNRKMGLLASVLNHLLEQYKSKNQEYFSLINFFINLKFDQRADSPAKEDPENLQLIPASEVVENVISFLYLNKISSISVNIIYFNCLDFRLGKRVSRGGIPRRGTFSSGATRR